MGHVAQIGSEVWTCRPSCILLRRDGEFLGWMEMLKDIEDNIGIILVDLCRQW